ncbi:integrase catalytic domain-containing protein [Trichonephila clavata]|uniref:Integrase catalytic domain-containing protein n=1 Tax=Trichonephila clavata TaxID=2740835 RepID=A0A8X6GZU3_TRICU|nr:integrase catalytic domain-containing protein [Trichonephila clavata]
MEKFQQEPVFRNTLKNTTRIQFSSCHEYSMKSFSNISKMKLKTLGSPARIKVQLGTQITCGGRKFVFLNDSTHNMDFELHFAGETMTIMKLGSFCVDDLISSDNECEETLQTSRRAKYNMKAAGMDLRKWITNYTNLMKQWKKENFDVYTVYVSLAANETKILGLSWNTHEDCLTTDTKSLLEFDSFGKNTKRFKLQAVGSPKVPRLVLDSNLLEDDVELHSFYDASKNAYSAAIYLRTLSRDGISAKLMTSKARVVP